MDFLKSIQDIELNFNLPAAIFQPSYQNSIFCVWRISFKGVFFWKIYTF